MTENQFYSWPHPKFVHMLSDKQQQPHLEVQTFNLATNQWEGCDTTVGALSLYPVTSLRARRKPDEYRLVFYPKTGELRLRNKRESLNSGDESNIRSRTAEAISGWHTIDELRSLFGDAYQLSVVAAADGAPPF
jgi:hypothetical protein